MADTLIKIAMDLMNPRHLRTGLLTAVIVPHKLANRCISLDVVLVIYVAK